MKKINLRKSNGITLIALVITIIVLLILAGVAIAMLSGENGILTKAADAKTKTGDAQKEEEKVLKDYEDVINESTGSVKKITFKKQGTGALAVGDEVETSNGEKFYVIGFSGNNANLLAKYNLKADGSSQDTTGENNACAFSSTNYWISASGIAYPDANGKYPDLNDETTYPIPEGETSIITTAKAYGKSLGVTGRLMRVEEIVSLGGITGDADTKNCPIFVNEVDGKKCKYWLGSAGDPNNVWDVYGNFSSVDYTGGYNSSEDLGIRPVIEVSKDLIK